MAQDAVESLFTQKRQEKIVVQKVSRAQFAENRSPIILPIGFGGTTTPGPANHIGASVIRVSGKITNVLEEVNGQRGGTSKKRLAAISVFLVVKNDIHTNSIV